MTSTVMRMMGCLGGNGETPIRVPDRKPRKNLELQDYRIEVEDYDNQTGQIAVEEYHDGKKIIRKEHREGDAYKRSFEPISRDTDAEIAENLVNEIARYSALQKGSSIASEAKKFLHRDEQLLLGPEGSILLCNDVYVEDGGGVQFVTGYAESTPLPFNEKLRNSATTVEAALNRRNAQRGGPIHMQGCHVAFTNKRMLILDVSFYQKTTKPEIKEKDEVKEKKTSSEEVGPTPSIKAADLNDNVNAATIPSAGFPEAKKERAEAIVKVHGEKTMSTHLVANFRTFRSVWLGEDVIDVGLDMSAVHQAAFSRKQAALTIEKICVLPLGWCLCFKGCFNEPHFDACACDEMTCCYQAVCAPYKFCCEPCEPFCPEEGFCFNRITLPIRNFFNDRFCNEATNACCAPCCFTYQRTETKICCFEEGHCCHTCIHYNHGPLCNYCTTILKDEIKTPVEVKRRDYLSSAEDNYRKVQRILNISTLRHGEIVLSLGETASFEGIAQLVGAISPEVPPEAFYAKQSSA